jgi:HK97 family phage major capsid protein
MTSGGQGFDALAGNARRRQTALPSLPLGVCGFVRDADAQRFEALTQRAEQIRQEERQRATASRDMLRRLASGDVRTEGGSTGTRTVDGTDPYAVADEDRPPANRQRDDAMRVLDRAAKAERLPARGAELIERLVDTGPDLERSWTARWVTETGSEHYRSAFAKLLHAGEQRAALEFTAAEAEAFRRVAQVKMQQRAMSLADTAGGYLVPFEMDPSLILTSSGGVSPLLSISRVVNTVTDVWHGVSSNGVVAEWLAEAAEASPTMAEPAVPNYKASVFVPFSVELQGDATALMQELGRLLTDGAAQLVNAALTLGSGVNQPTGIITALVASSPTVIVNSATTDTFAATDIYALQNALPPRLQANAQWCANLSIINSARRFESANGAIKFPELAQSPPMLLGRKINECSPMDGVINTGQENYVLVYGDFSNYVVTQRVGSTVELIPHLVGSNRRPTGQRGVWLWARYGADSVVDNAFRLLDVT